MTSLTGVNVIQYYQTILYKSLGIGSTTILALAGVYGTVAFVSNLITTIFLTDQWGRRKMILAGLCGIILVEIYAAVMQREFQNTNNRFDGMLNSTTWLYGAEILPIALRSKIMGIGAASHFIVNVGIVAYLYFPETKRKTLEEIAAAFGDKVVLLDETQQDPTSLKPGMEEVDDVSPV
ncbi:hypothetical protein SLS53_008993 [Cytospora paraplurivora]|uniref:Major facilitator superfamily (MFS) profile domain-containing protein n=1 Tax=Cytospora paraplurivora TaxID=2898453 RepID=A0AAN9TWB4_9PEZI